MRGINVGLLCEIFRKFNIPAATSVSTPSTLPFAVGMELFPTHSGIYNAYAEY
jgi:hypothetical protein